MILAVGGIASQQSLEGFQLGNPPSTTELPNVRVEIEVYRFKKSFLGTMFVFLDNYNQGRRKIDRTSGKFIAASGILKIYRTTKPETHHWAETYVPFYLQAQLR